MDSTDIIITVLATTNAYTNLSNVVRSPEMDTLVCGLAEGERIASTDYVDANLIPMLHALYKAIGLPTETVFGNSNSLLKLTISNSRRNRNVYMYSTEDGRDIYFKASVRVSDIFPI